MNIDNPNIGAGDTPATKDAGKACPFPKGIVCSSIEYWKFRPFKNNYAGPGYPTESSSKVVDSMKAIDFVTHKMRGFLKSLPILCVWHGEEEKCVMMTGKYQYGAAMQVEVPFYFIVLDSSAYDEYVTMRSKGSETTADAWLNFWIRNDSSDFKQVKKFMDDYKLDVHPAMRLMSMFRYGPTLANRKLIAGEFTVSEEDMAFAHQVMETVKRFEDFGCRRARQVAFTMALARYQLPGTGIDEKYLCFKGKTRYWKLEPKVLVNGKVESAHTEAEYVKLLANGKVERAHTEDEYVTLLMDEVYDFHDRRKGEERPPAQSWLWNIQMLTKRQEEIGENLMGDFKPLTKFILRGQIF